MNARGANNQSYTDRNPEEKVRAVVYAELLYRYQYDPKDIWIENEVPKRPSGDYADITINYPTDAKKTYLVIEVKKEGITDSQVRKAIQQGYGYANYFDADYFFFDCNDHRRRALELRKPDGTKWGGKEYERNIVSDIPIRYGKVPEFKYKRSKSKGDPWELKPASGKELDTIFQKCHDILWSGGERNPAEAFDEMSKLIFAKNYDETFTAIGDFYKFQIGTHETKDDVTKRIIDELYAPAQKKEPNVFTSEIKAISSNIYQVVELLQGISLKDTDLDAKGRAFEQFLGTVFRGQMGQYFTRRELVNFSVYMMEPTYEDMIIDPACGSGGFLLYSMIAVRNAIKNRFGEGSDVEKEFVGNHVFGIEKNVQIARVSMMDMIIHDDGHTNIEANDALDKWDSFDPRKDIRPNKYTLVLTNPPFGADIKEEEYDYLQEYVLGAKLKPRKTQKSDILFLERCLELLSPNSEDLSDRRKGGRMGIVLPEGILNNSSLWYVRKFIEERAWILAVISLPQHAFRKAGSGVKASLVFLRKFTNDEKIEWNQIKSRLMEAVKTELSTMKENLEASVDEILQQRQLNNRISNDLDIRWKIKKLKAIANKTSDDKFQREVGTLNREYKKIALFNVDYEAHKRVMKEKAYPIFLGIAEHIGYDATGRPDKNDLFSVNEAGEVERKDEKSILGQWFLYCQDPDRYYADFLSELTRKPDIVKESNCFATTSSEATERLDAHYHKPSYLIKQAELEGTEYSIHYFSEYVKEIVNGIDLREYFEEGTRYLRVANIKEGGIDTSDVKHVNKTSEELSKRGIQLEVNDLLLTRKGTFGIAIIVEEDYTDCIISSEIIRIKLYKNIDPYYLATFINSSWGRFQIERNTAGGIMKHLDQEAVLSIQVIVPPDQIPKQIATEINSRWSDIRNLQQEVELIKDKLRRDASKMILGVSD